MGRILAIDFGRKRTGLAVSDPLRIIANGLTTVKSEEIFNFIRDYNINEELDEIVVGYPKKLNNEGSEALVYINPFIKKLKIEFPDIPLKIYDERFTSKLAEKTKIDGGLKKEKRQDKALTDKISATILLQSYMESIREM